MITIGTFKRGFVNGFKTLWLLSKVLVPVYLLITLIRLTPIIDWISLVFKPLMFIFGLPGEAAIVLVLGNTLNLYAALGAIASLTLTVKQITILAVMLAFSHSLIVETAIFNKLNVPVTKVVTFRISLGVLSGVILNLIL
ncbi:nucleoside recognition protein [Fusibacter bizertensis]|uniref:Nucleoside recognition protein n=1 Tax=Fusibacter bizertensis TaxID=1488331 RepID=A0ABT6N9U1_9FIRM|nr:nucleoside recognition domain-containing protein [Fusibacter bizertensis]MDH8677172.1 nucleoside recognition protein [Fusibacter bizertensis]